MSHERDEDGASNDPASNRPMSLQDIQESYAKYADLMRRFEWFDRLLTGRYRRERFSDAEGRVLDVACGTGTNFRYLPDTVELVGIDISPEMLANARDQLDGLAVNGTLREMNAQDLEFPDGSFDTVISSLSTCTFPDPIAALREMERVCTPDGSIRLVEHGRSDVAVIARYQELRDDSHYAKAGCRRTQKPREIVAQAGLRARDTSTGLFGTVTTFEITPTEV